MRRKKPRKPPCSSNTHHYWWPKKLYRWNTLITIDKVFHCEYHSYFHRHCMKSNRICHDECLYKNVCCYRNSGIAFGKVIPWAEEA